MSRVGDRRAVVVAVEYPVQITIDAETGAGAGRHGGVRELLPGYVGKGAQGNVCERGLEGLVALERAGRLSDPAPSGPRDGALHDHVALRDVPAEDLRRERGTGPLEQGVDAPASDRGVRVVERHLLADDRGDVAVEGEQELLHLTALRIATVETDAVVVVEDRRLQEAKDRVDAPVVQEAEAAYLVAL